MNKYVVTYNSNKALLDDYQVIEGKNAKDALKKAFNKDYKRLTGDAGRHVSIILIKGDFRDNTIYYQGKYQLLCYGEC